MYNQYGTKLVTYTYDAWGSCTTTYVNAGAPVYMPKYLIVEGTIEDFEKLFEGKIIKKQ